MCEDLGSILTTKKRNETKQMSFESHSSYKDHINTNTDDTRKYKTGKAHVCFHFRCSRENQESLIAKAEIKGYTFFFFFFAVPGLNSGPIP
jgi:hypothetical protein